MILNKANPETLSIVAKALRNGGIGVIPCDTMYGLCGLMGIGEKPLQYLKNREAKKPFLVIATLEQAKELAAEPLPQPLLDTWPAPLTVILNSVSGGTIAIRVPKDPYLQKLLEIVKKPIYSTSVNMSGEPTLVAFKDIQQRFESQVDFLVKASDEQGTVPSTLLDLTQKPPKVLRQGSFDASSIIASLS
ncbi:MAG: L-threonylcarbamoyladenylate synthase [Sphaerochaetaceae bacterium]|jgi:L-threonylcarbamoyladenylate synthase|nr:L-threonylcarbamoyladenylate synthase [Sphaerochaetaceae bacterium]